ncbi:hypothetical protein PB2503_04867 [Parvularcula bermudensis HTCC2503]|uniref:Gcp-like domain-containing protein n=1 Tax=Parvularcula bermudensis (strain ATCC BAA-594 / HTCC2503 / KCTC 12087) TaxID=314260 RepID=E0TFN3_PARBH|nr:hypothetical protein PB2503_04867 [Parvularcula bermudensis HTCC2503]
MPTLSVALATQASCAVFQERIGTGHAERLAPVVRDMLAANGVAVGDLTDLIVTVGPGSFMGVRVGISFAGGLLAAGGITSRPVTLPRALRASAPSQQQGVCLIDIRRGQVSATVFEGEAIGAAELIDLETARQRWPNPDTAGVIGDGQRAIWPDRPPTGPLVPDIAQLARTPGKWAPGPFVPVYSRPPDARPPAPLVPIGAQ